MSNIPRGVVKEAVYRPMSISVRGLIVSATTPVDGLSLNKILRSRIISLLDFDCIFLGLFERLGVLEPRDSSIFGEV